jgi:hypothetical protein
MACDGEPSISREAISRFDQDEGMKDILGRDPLITLRTSLRPLHDFLVTVLSIIYVDMNHSRTLTDQLSMTKLHSIGTRRSLNTCIIHFSSISMDLLVSKR